MTVRDSRGEWYKIRDSFYLRDFLLFASNDGTYISYLPEHVWDKYIIEETGEFMEDVDIEQEDVFKNVDPKDSSCGWVCICDETGNFAKTLYDALYGLHMTVLQGGTKKDDIRAYGLMSISSFAKDKYRTFEMLKKGRGTDIDLAKAFIYCETAANMGYSPAKRELEDILKTGGKLNPMNTKRK